MPRTLTIRDASPQDAADIAAIYDEGIEERVATFETRLRSAEEIGAWFGDDLPFVVADNLASRAVHRAAGFTEVGLQRRHGRLDGEWKDCVLVERLLGAAAADP